MAVSAAPVIDLNAYRSARAASRGLDRAGLAPAPVAMAPVMWVPVMLMPYWIAPQPFGRAG